MFSNLVIGYLFLGGAGGGFLAILCALEYANTSQRYLGRFAFPVDFFERAWILCAAVLALAMVLLVADLGVTDRLFYVLAFPTFSPLTVGAYALVASLAVAVSFAVISHISLDYAATIPVQKLKGAPRTANIAAYALRYQPGVAWNGVRMRPDRTVGLAWGMYALEAIGVGAGAVVVVYTGVLFATMPSVLAWETPLLPTLFVLSSISCGIALLFVSAAFTESRQTFFQSLRRITNFDTALIVAEGICLAVYLAWCLQGSTTHEAGVALLSGDLAPWMWGMLVATGLVAPVFLERLITRLNYRTQLIWVAGGILVGGFALRYCVAGLAAYDPSTIYALAMAGA